MVDANGWMPIETAPMDGTTILATWDEFVFPVAWEVMPGKPLWGWRVARWENPGWLLFVIPTHWMPLPAPHAMLEAATGETKGG